MWLVVSASTVAGVEPAVRGEVCQQLGLATEPRHVEGMRSKL